LTRTREKSNSVYLVCSVYSFNFSKFENIFAALNLYSCKCKMSDVAMRL
jgi:hypothetical protein